MQCNRNSLGIEIFASLRLTVSRKVALDQVAYEKEARGLESLKILGFSRCNESTIGDRAVNNPNPTGCNVIETVSVFFFFFFFLYENFALYFKS